MAQKLDLSGSAANTVFSDFAGHNHWSDLICQGYDPVNSEEAKDKCKPHWGDSMILVIKQAGNGVFILTDVRVAPTSGKVMVIVTNLKLSCQIYPICVISTMPQGTKYSQACSFAE